MLRVAEHWSGTDTGRQRRANEDSLLVRSPLFVVADGMGGAQAGEVASHMAVESFRHGLADRSDPQASLAELVRQANARINERSRSDARHAGMGTTITAMYVGEEEVAIAHVGDSRAYCLREGELVRLTDDHSLVDELIRQGRLTPQEAEEHPQRSVITRALGPEDYVEVDTRSFRARSHDVFLLCSDGLTTMVGEDQLTELLSSHRDMRGAGEALIAAANEAGGKDNITVVLARLEEGPPGPGRGDGHTTITAAHTLKTTPTDSRDQAASEVAPGQTAPEVAPGQAAPTAPPDQVASRLAREQTAPTIPRSPRLAAPKSARARARGRRAALRRLRAPLVLLVVLAAIAAGAYVAIESVYFIGTDSRGLVTVFRGVPFELPGGLRLYGSDYVSGVSASTLSPQRRQTLLDHSLRSEKDAAELVRQLELGELSER
jgi:serine/threonine protein phosphatase PrpC